MALLTVITAVALGGGVANATETRRFVGVGTSDFGLALFYARTQAQTQAEAAGFTDCEEIWTKVWPYSARVVWECTR